MEWTTSCPLRVLIVDDCPDNRETTARLLRLWGCEVRLAADGAAALAAAAWRPDVVLLDIGLPRMDGYEVARRLRADPRTARTFLAALTGLARDEDRRRALAAGCDRHLAKPVDPDELLRLLGALSAPTARRLCENSAAPA
jgi:CheY-like chemotaxis protein